MEFQSEFEIEKTKSIIYPAYVGLCIKNSKIVYYVFKQNFQSTIILVKNFTVTQGHSRRTSLLCNPGSWNSRMRGKICNQRPAYQSMSEPEIENSADYHKHRICQLGCASQAPSRNAFVGCVDDSLKRTKRPSERRISISFSMESKYQYREIHNVY